jgi:putative copper resistance protein D
MDAPLDLVLSRWAFLVPTMVLFGSSLFTFYAYPKGRRVDAALPTAARVVLAAWSLAASFTWLAALARHLDDSSPLATTIQTVLFQTTFGPSWIARLALCLTAAAAACFNLPRILIAASAGALICEGWDGHAAAHGQLGELVQAVHVLCASLWIGGLVALTMTVSSAIRRREERSAFGPVRQFSKFGAVGVSLLLLTGVLNVTLLGPGLDLTGDYAKTLGIKLALFVPMLGLALFNRMRVMGRAETGDERRNLKLLLATTAFEQALGLGVLLAVSRLGLLDPYMAGMSGM